MKGIKNDDPVKSLYEKPKRKNSLQRLLSKNQDEGSGNMLGFGSFNLPKDKPVVDDDFPEPPPNQRLEN